MPLKTADDLLDISVDGFASNLTQLDLRATRQGKWQLQRLILMSGRILEMVEADYLGWQAQVGQGQHKFDQKDADAYTKRFAGLVLIFDNLYATAKRMEGEMCDNVSHSNDVYIWTLKAKRLRDEKRVPPPPPRMVFDVTEQEEKEIQALLSAPAGAPGKLNCVPSSIPLADASFLK